jgi:hypothetical protein
MSKRGEETLLGKLQDDGGEGVGPRLILRFLQHIPGVGEYVVNQQLANLKASGDYARILHEVEDEIAREHEETLR